MATQLHNGSWTESEPIDKALLTLFKHVDEGTAKRFVIGTEKQLKEEKEKINQEDRLAKIECRLETLEALRSGLLVEPTPDEIKMYGSK